MLPIFPSDRSLRWLSGVRAAEPIPATVLSPLPHDGYTLTGLSESNVTAGVQGGWDKNFNVWDVFIVGGSPDIISVTPDTPYKTLKDLIEAAKKKPGNPAALKQLPAVPAPSII
jgi:hypothetical protein